MNFLTAVKAGRLVDSKSLKYSLMGKYKNGITAISDSGQVIFLTGNRVRGPFTVFVPGIENFLGVFQQGQIVITDQISIRIPEADLFISSDSMDIWPPYENENPQVCDVSRIRISSLNVLSDCCQAGIREMDSVCALKAYLDHYQCNEVLGGTQKAFISNFAAIHQAFSEDNYYGIIEAATGLIGLGGGITPAGDDFLAGFLIALSYVGDQLGISKKIYLHIAEEIILRSKKKTNPISAALLGAALQKEMNEPLFSVIQSLVRGTRVSFEAIHNLSSVGHTSGFDGLTGCLFVFCVLLGEFEHLKSKPIEVELDVYTKKEIFQ